MNLCEIRRDKKEKISVFYKSTKAVNNLPKYIFQIISILQTIVSYSLCNILKFLRSNFYFFINLISQNKWESQSKNENDIMIIQKSILSLNFIFNSYCKQI